MSNQLDERIRHMMQHVVDESPPPPAVATNAPPAPLAHRGVPYWIIVTAVATVLVLIGGAGWLFSTGGAEVADEPLPSTTSVSTTPTVTLTTAMAPTTMSLSSHLEPAQLQLGDEIGFSQSGDTLWARDEDGEIVGYRDGAWHALPPLPGRVLDVAGTMNGPIWAVTESNLWYLEDGEWRSLLGAVAHRIEAENVEVDGATGNVWVLSGADLYRWDGVVMSQVGSSPEGMVLDGLVVAGDGTIWGARDNFYFPWMDRLARFNWDTGAWVSVRPLGGTKDLPAIIAITPSGNLWAGLRRPEAMPSDPTGFVLAYLDTATGEWAASLLPGGSAGDIVADDEVVWFHGVGSSDLMRFDGETLAVVSPDGLIDNLGLGNDGTLWITVPDERNGVYRLVIDEQPTG